MKCLYILSFLLLLGSGTLKAQQKTEHIMVDGLSREFITYLPKGADLTHKLPVIISLHGRLGTASGMVKFADFRPIADREKVIIVCPQGIDRSWNDGRQSPARLYLSNTLFVTLQSGYQAYVPQGRSLAVALKALAVAGVLIEA